MRKRTVNRDSNKYLYTVFIAALFTMAKRWKQLKCPRKDEWINKAWCRQTMEYSFVLKRKEIL